MAPPPSNQMLCIDNNVYNLRSRKKVKFKHLLRNMQRLLKSPLSRGIKIWDRIPQAIQRSLTKVKFKIALKYVVNL